jgi:hypothetical protein
VTINLNFDRNTGNELKFEDILDNADEGKIFALCRSQVAKEKRGRADVEGLTNHNDDIDPAEIEEGTKQFSNWRFDASSVDIYYGDYAFGGYGQCMCNCTISYSVLRPVAKKSFPLP